MVGVGACGVALFSVVVGLFVGQMVMSVLSVSFGLCNCRRFFVPGSFCLWSVLVLVSLLCFLSLSFELSLMSSCRLFMSHVGFVIVGIFLFQGRFVCGFCLFWCRFMGLFCVWAFGGMGFQLSHAKCLLLVQNALIVLVVWACVLCPLVS